MIITNAKLRGKEDLQEILIENGKFKDIGKKVLRENAETIIDAKGKLVLPPFVEPHVHLDTTLTAGEPIVNTHLQGRFDTYPKRRGITRVKEFLESNINVCFGHDDIMDPWYPLGNGNMLQVLQMGIHVCQLMGYDEIKNSIDLITKNSSTTLNIEDKYGIEKGKDANLIILNSKDEFDAIRLQSPVVYSIRNGNIISHTHPSSTKIFLGNEENVEF